MCNYTILSIPFGPRLVRTASATARVMKILQVKIFYQAEEEIFKVSLKLLTFSCSYISHSYFCRLFLVLEGISFA